MKKIYALFAFCLLCLPAQARDSYAIAATVNNDVITSRDVDGRVAMALQGANLPDDDNVRKTLRRQALDSLVDEQIRLQEAERLSAEPTAEDMDAAFAKLARQNNLSADEFKAALSRTPALYPSVMRQIKAQLAWAAVVRKRIRPQVNITETDITNYLAERKRNPARVEFNIAEIFLKNADGNMDLAKNLVSELRGGSKRFSVVAKQFSSGLEAGKGGLLGWIPEGRLEPEIDAALADTAPGQITDPVVSPRGIHIFLVRDKRQTSYNTEGQEQFNIKQAVVPLPMEDVPDDMERKARDQARFFQANATDCAAMDGVIEKINHPLSRDIGYIPLADMPAPVAKIVKELPTGQASDPIRANDGYVVVMVCDRKKTDTEQLREEAANTLGMERLNRLQYRYYRDLRAAAYVDIRAK